MVATYSVNIVLFLNFVKMFRGKVFTKSQLQAEVDGWTSDEEKTT